MHQPTLSLSLSLSYSLVPPNTHTHTHTETHRQADPTLAGVVFCYASSYWRA
jgi:hypothetical protein